MLLWRRAIIRSLVTHLVCDRELAANVSEDEVDLIWNDYGALVRRSLAGPVVGLQPAQRDPHRP
jgi:hypothetical protein